MERKYYEAYDDRYRQVHSLGIHWFDKGPSDIVGETIRNYGISGNILELGCGEGRDASFLLSQGFDVLATDISPAAITFCRKNDPLHHDRYRVLDCVCGELEEKFDFIYAVAVVHMLVDDGDRAAFYGFIREHLKEGGIALVCSMGDGITERCSDAARAFDVQTRIHEPTGREVEIASTSYRAVSFDTFRREIANAGLTILQDGLTDIRPDYYKIMYAVMKKG